MTRVDLDNDEPFTPAELLQLAAEACACDNKDCGVTLTSKCHPKAGVTVKFFRQTGILQIWCKKCDEPCWLIQLIGKH